MLEIRNFGAWLVGAILLLSLIDVCSNAYVSLSGKRNLLGSEGWTAHVFETSESEILSSINEAFGLRADVSAETDAASDAEASLLAEKLAREAEEIAKEKLLKLGSNDLRLFGLSSMSGERVALISINHGKMSGEITTLRYEQTFVLADGQISIKPTNFSQNAVSLLVVNKNDGTEQIFNLVLFNYDF